MRRARVHYPGTYTHTVVELKYSQPQAPGYNRRCCEVWDSRGESENILSFANTLGKHGEHKPLQDTCSSGPLGSAILGSTFRGPYC